MIDFFHKLVAHVTIFSIFHRSLLPMKRRLSPLDLFVLFDDDEEDEIVCQILQTLQFAKRKKTHQMIRNRDTEGVYSIFIQKYLVTEGDKFVKYLRVSPCLFGRILENICDSITTMPTNKVPKPISPQHKLCVALRYLATGESITSLSFAFRISQPCLTKIMKDVFKAISETMLNEIPMPTKEQFQRIAEEFFQKWNFPNAIGCLDGKHVRIRCPNSTGSTYFNYKDFFSVVLLALVDANYKIIAIDVGSFGREGDSVMNSIFHIK